MTKPSRRTALAVVLGAALAAVTGCGGGGSSGEAPGVTDTTVKIGSHQPLTGPAAPGYSEIAPAAKAFFEYINAHGGVNGRKIDYVYKDDGYNPTNTVSVTRQLVLQDKVFAIFNGLGTPTHTKVMPYLNANKVPDVFVASGCPCLDGDENPQTFGWQTNYQLEGKVIGSYLKEEFPGKKIGVFYQDDDFGQGALAGLKRFVGDQVVAEEPYQSGNTNVAPQITAIQKSGADVMVDFTVPAYTALAQLAAFKLGYKPQLVLSNVGADPTTVGALLKGFSKGAADTALIEGAITSAYLPSPTDASNPWIELFRQVHEEAGLKSPFDGNVVFGMAAAYTFAQALDAAGEDPTREGLVKAIEQGGFTGPGLVPLRYSATQHGGYGGVQLAKITDGEVVAFGTPQTTDPEDGPIEPYEEGQPVPDESGLLGG